MIQTLVKNKKYIGKYVAMEDFTKPKVVGAGNTPTEAYEKAVSKGYDMPVIAFVPAKNMVQIYYVSY
ncbi:MAG: hypothetical protein KAJ79_01760 [Candidatus Omnitrophica bacterium]|nr:hypothetical protein [Candidatus Omnitrophota bacterium]